MPDFLADHSENRHAAFRAELGLARVTGIEKENAVHRLRERLVRVAENDGVRLLLLDLRLDRFGQRPRIDDVMDEKFFRRERYDFRELERQADVHIALHHGHGRDEFQFQFNHRIADVARVQNVFHTVKDFFHARVEKSVRVGDDANLHALASSGSASVSVAGSRAPAVFSAGDSAVSFCAAANSAVKIPPLKSVLRKNSHVEG